MKRAAILTGLLWSIAERALAQNAPPPPTLCGGLPGCGQPPANVIAQNIIPNFLLLGLRVCAGLALIMIIWYGLLLMRATDDGDRTKAKDGVKFALIGLFLAIASGRIVSFVVTENWGQNNPSDLLYGGIMASVVRVFITLSNVLLGYMVVYNGFKMVIAQGKSDEFNAARSGVFWAIVGAVLINSARAIIKMVITLPI